jgi:hypothetical protein
MEGICRGLIEVYLWIYQEGPRKVTKSLSEDSRCFLLNSKQVPPEYNAKA